jgi:hypothetical protein
MLQLIKGSIVVVASSIPLEPSLSIPNKFEKVPDIYQEYKSPTLNYNPFAEYEEKLLNELIEKVFIKEE